MSIPPAVPPAAKHGLCIPQRYILAFMGFLCFANGYIQRFCLSLAITEMVIPQDSSAEETSSVVDPYACPTPASSSVNASVKGLIGADASSWAEFDWSEETQGLILSAVFWGYVLTQVPGGLLAERYGGKWVLATGMLMSAVSTLLTPPIARMGATYLIVARFFVGLGQGVMYPSVNVMLAQWTPPHERGRLGSAVFAGAQIGNVVAMAMGGLLMRYIEGGWVNVFYVFGAVGVAWVMLFVVLCYSDPESHPFISEHEKLYLMTHAVGVLKKRQDLPPTPWRHILTSVPLLGLIIAQVGHDWGLFTIISDLPKYMKTVMKFSIAQNGFLSAAPYLAMWVFALISGVIVDNLVKRQYSVTFVRKLFVSIAATGPAAGILLATYSGCDRVLVATFFTIGMGLMGAFVPSLKVNALDLSPNYAGTCLALVGGVGAISGIITPYLVGLLTPHGTLLEWRLVFWIAVIVLLSTNVVFLLTGSGETQPWNDPSTMDCHRPTIVSSGRKPSSQDKNLEAAETRLQS